MTQLIIYFFICCFSLTPKEEMLLIDTRLKLPPVQASEFDEQQIFHHQFPIYRSDLNSLLASLEFAAKAINHQIKCGGKYDWKNGRTRLSVTTHCNSEKTSAVWLRTKVDDISVSFPLLQSEPNIRKAQKRVLDFST